MKIEYQIRKSEFIKLKFSLLFRKPLIIVACFVVLILLLFDLRKLIFYHFPVQTIYASSFMFIWCFILLPTYYYIKFGKEYKSNKLLSLKTVSEIDSSKICDTTETFRTETSWENVHKVKESKNWFLFYFSNDIFGFAPKRVFSENQIKELRNLIINKNVKSDLLKD